MAKPQDANHPKLRKKGSVAEIPHSGDLEHTRRAGVTCALRAQVTIAKACMLEVPALGAPHFVFCFVLVDFHLAV